MNAVKCVRVRATLVALVLCGATGARAETATVESPDRVAIDRARSNDLRLRILASTVLVMVDDHDLAKGIYLEETIPAADLVEQARGSTDPLVLDLMAARCDVPFRSGKGCDALAFARRWTEADTQNQVAWLTLASALRSCGDEDGARATFLRAAQASTWHEHDLDLARVVTSHAPPDLKPASRYAMLRDAAGKARAQGIPFPALSTLGAYCKEPGDLRAACARIVATMARDTDSLMGLTLSAAYAARAHVDPLVVATYRMQSDAVHWSLPSRVSTLNGEDDPAKMDDETLRQRIAQLQARIDVGERRVGEDDLLAQHLSRSEAAARYVATLTPSQLQQRIAMTSSP